MLIFKNVKTWLKRLIYGRLMLIHGRFACGIHVADSNGMFFGFTPRGAWLVQSLLHIIHLKNNGGWRRLTPVPPRFLPRLQVQKFDPLDVLSRSHNLPLGIANELHHILSLSHPQAPKPAQAKPYKLWCLNFQSLSRVITFGATSALNSLFISRQEVQLPTLSVLWLALWSVRVKKPSQSQSAHSGKVDPNSCQWFFSSFSTSGFLHLEKCVCFFRPTSIRLRAFCKPAMNSSGVTVPPHCFDKYISYV